MGSAKPPMSTSEAAIFEDIVDRRRSVRAFLPDSIPDHVLEHIFSIAQKSPSNCNAQPWITHVVSGDTAARLSARLTQAAASGLEPAPDYGLAMQYQGVYRTRQIEAAKALFAATGVRRENMNERERSFLRNFELFDAPHAAFIFLPDWAEFRQAADCGIYLQTLMLALTAQGLASCAQGALSYYADIVHEELNVPAEYKLLFGLSFGYADKAHPANTVRTNRAPIAEAVVFHP